MENIYFKMPLILQNASVSLKGKLLNKQRYDSRFFEIFNNVIDRETLNEKEIKELQNTRLKEIAEKVIEVSPFYKKLFSDFDFDLNTPISSLKNMPILDKEQMKINFTFIFDESYPKKELIEAKTSGTTGSGFHFYKTKDAEKEQWAIWWRYRRWHGINLGTWCAYFGGRSVVSIEQTTPPFWRVNKPGKQLMFSVYHINRETAKDYIKAIKDSKVSWIHGYSSAITLLASFILELDLDVGENIRIVTIGSEGLLPFQKEIIENAFKVPVRQHYGLAEPVANISECEEGNLHVDEDYSYVEFIPLNKDVYKIIGTSFISPAFFFLRYDTGDNVVLKEGNCSCGRNGRLVEEIDGRREDYVVLRNGVAVGRLSHIPKYVPNIKETQVYQEEPGIVEFRVVKGANYSQDDEKRLLKEAKKRLGEDCKIDIKYVDEISRTKNGKIRFVISKVSPFNVSGT